MKTPATRPFLAVAVTLALAGSLGGCTYLKQSRDEVVPVAVPSMREAQTLNPDAGKNRKVVAGLDGRAGAKVSEGYSKSFEKQQGQQKATESFQGMAGVSAN